MDFVSKVDSVSVAETVMGEAAEQLRLYGQARGTADRKGVKLGEWLFEHGFDPNWLISPYTQGGKPKPDVVKANEVIEWHGEKYSRFQMYDASKWLVASSYLCKADFELWQRDPAELKTALEKAARSMTVKQVGGVISDIRRSIIAHKEREDRKSDPTTPGSGKSDEVRIGERCIAIIRIAQKAEEPDYDATAVCAKARELLALVGQSDTTQEKNES